MSHFPAKVMATLVALLFLLVADITSTSASLPYYGGQKCLSLDVLTKTIPRLEGSFEGLNINSKKIVYFRSLRKRGLLPPPSPVRNRPISWKKPEPAPPPPQIL
ncbi:hypothetical protein FH972_019192 [Carpinus fangiana]|uniref:Uncharacterized protein n=1 Tax=Carpinus fangiana TaxID=176857 RepID=A0A5N6RSW9_9ROSI|nr:hypothetical protein FH972_019192 [Carpinus fangiana]